jgi:hypothetical protein
VKPPYIHPIRKVGKFTVWIVDGPWIRDHLKPDGEDFTNFGQHFACKYIPMYEWWIDEDSEAYERGFFILNMSVQWRLMNQGKSYDEAYDEAIKAEEKARGVAADRSSDLPWAQVVIRTLHVTADDLIVELVRDDLIRTHDNINFTEGGHWLVPGYDFIPKGHIAIAVQIFKQGSKETGLTELHEKSENWKMIKAGIKYPPAHKFATKVTHDARENPDTITSELAKYGW